MSKGIQSLQNFIAYNQIKADYMQLDKIMILLTSKGSKSFKRMQNEIAVDLVHRVIANKKVLDLDSASDYELLETLKQL